MSRRPSVGAKNGHWNSEAGGTARYFGRVDSVSRAEAMALLWTALADAGEGGGGDRGGRGFTPGDASASSANELTNSGSSASATASFFANSLSSQARDANDAAEGAGSKTFHPLSTLTVGELRDRFLAWLLRHRSAASHREAKRHLGRWCDADGEMHAVAIAVTHLESFQDALIADGHALIYVKKHATTVRAM